MQTIEMYFNNTIAQYSSFIEAAFQLTQEISALTPIEVQDRCATLRTQQRELTDTGNQLCLIMESMGPEILDTSYVGELQRVIDKSVLACTPLRAELLVYQNKLHLPT